MSILIKGMKMPKFCAVCCIADWEYDCCPVADRKNIRITDTSCRPDFCPLVELPDHGALIDRDAMAKDLAYDVEMDEKALDDINIVGIEREKLQFDKDCKQNCMYYLTEQEPVIPAERSEE